MAGVTPFREQRLHGFGVELKRVDPGLAACFHAENHQDGSAAEKLDQTSHGSERPFY
jgi:hypothetical protein